MTGIDAVLQNWIERTQRVGGMFEDHRILSREIRVLKSAQVITRTLGYSQLIQVEVPDLIK
jgi:hypothetical protein